MPPFLGRGGGSPSNTMSPGLRPTSIPGGILIHPAVWPQYTITDSQNRHDTQDSTGQDRQKNGLIAQGEQFYKRSPKNGSPYPIGPIVCLSMSCLSVTLVYCGPTVGWLRMKLGMEVGLGPGHIVLDGDPAPPPSKGHSPQCFGPCLLWPNGWMDQDATW